MLRRIYAGSVSVSRVAVFLALSFGGHAQGIEQSLLVVEVESDSPTHLRHLSAELQDVGRKTVAEATLTSDDRFTFRGVPSGQYWLVVTDGNGTTLSESSVSVAPVTWSTVLRLSPPSQQLPPSGGISVAELRKPLARQAVRAAADALKQSAAGHDDKAVELLQKAIGISPEYAAAYTNLTAAYLRMGDTDRAIATAQRAIEVVSAAHGKPSSVDFSNLAYAQLLKKRYTEAAANSRHALELAPDSDKAHMVLGMTLAVGGGDLREAAQHLEFASKTLPTAQPMLDAVQQALARVAARQTQSAQR
jgi:tetratricopeptide (TPR) repeat protein